MTDIEIPQIEPFASPPTTTPWVPMWPVSQPMKESELAYAEITASASITATTEATAQAVVTAPPITVDGATTILVEFFAPLGANPPAIGFFDFALYQDGASIGLLGRIANPSSAGGLTVPLALRRRLTPAAGSRTYSIRAFINTGTGTVFAGPGNALGAVHPAFIRISAPTSPFPVFPGASIPVAYGTSLPVGPVDGQEAILVDSLTAPTFSWRFRYNAGNASAYKWEFIGGSGYGTAFPAAPQHGGEFTLVDSLTNPSFQWRFRYNAGSSSAYKWEFIGGAPAISEVLTSQATTSLTFVDLATVGPQITTPREGDYIAEANLLMHGGGNAGTKPTAGIKYGASAIGGEIMYGSESGLEDSVGITVGKRAVAIGQVVKIQYRIANNLAPGTFWNRILTLTPVRCL